jgi:fructuronate reductase
MPVTARRLSLAVLRDLPPSIRRPAYDPAQARIGIVHFGPGAFHRAHQAAYIDDLLAAHPDWAICGVSLHSAEVRDALGSQDLLFSLALLGEQTTLRVIASIRELLHAPAQQAGVLARLADPDVRLVTLTITEKGYCLAGEELDLAHPDIAHDLAVPATPRGVIGYLVAGLAARRRRALAPFTVLSCDNLAGNGRKLRRATLQYASRVDASLARWIESEVAFPCSMVDSITPATDVTLRQQVSDALGCIDAWPVQRERFTQWVVEDDFCNARPPLEQAGVTFSRDIAGYDRAKLRLLNGAHSSLAYLGSLLGLEAVRDTMRCVPLARFVERLMKECILPSIALPTGLNGDAYINAILERFCNPAIDHKLSQIAWDGSQKLPVRLLPTIADALAQGRDIAVLCLPVAAWLCFVRRQARAEVQLVDPMDEVLRGVGRACTGEAAADTAAFLRLDAVFGALGADTRFMAALRDAYASLGDGSAPAVARALA